jgi:hypothetical protein
MSGSTSPATPGTATRDKGRDSGGDDRIDAAIDDSFPASDPPSFTPVSGETGAASSESGHADAAGTPHADRHATETAAGRLEGHEHPEHKES